MFSSLALITLFSICSATSLCPKDKEFNRHDPRQSVQKQSCSEEKTIAPPMAPTSQEDTAPLYRAMPDDNDIVVDDDTEHGPLGAICSELAEYCSYFANNIMADAQQQRNRDSLLLFCNVMRLMADLADAEVTPMRAESYTTDVISIMTSMKDALRSDADLKQDYASFPLLQKLASIQDSKGNEPMNDEIGIYLHNVLRTSEMAKPLLSQLFAELNVYAQKKVHILLAMFHHDSRKLLDLTIAPIDSQKKTPRHSSQQNAESRNQHQMSWLCHHAAEACIDIANSLQSNASLKHAAPLISQVQSMMSAMALTYKNLSADPTMVRSHDRHALATHFACMIHLLPETSPLRSHSHSPESAYLDKCTQLKTSEEKQRFVENAFGSELDRDALLAEFFPAFETAIDYNLDSFSTTIGLFTTQTFAQRYWHTTPLNQSSHE